MDNRVMRIQSEGEEAFDMALALLWANAPGRAMHYWSVVEPNGIEPDPYAARDPEDTQVQGYKAKTLVLFWSRPKLWPYGQVRAKRLNFNRGKKFAWEWLQEQTERDEHIDMDGSLGNGFLAFNEQWGFVGGSAYGFAAIRPIYSWYGK